MHFPLAVSLKLAGVGLRLQTAHMVRGFVYSFIAVCIYLMGSILWMSLAQLDEQSAYLMSGWLLVICFFAVGPLFFAVGYWHHLRLHPKDSHWDAEIGQ